MNRAYWIVAIVVVTLLLIGGIIFWIVSPKEPVSPGPNGNTNVPGGNTTVTVVVPSGQQVTPTTTPVATLFVSSPLGGTIVVRDFRKDPTTETSPDSPGLYMISGGFDHTFNETPYSIYYLESDTSFTITLLSEPIGEMRKRAETELLSSLGITEAFACALRYTVLVPHRVNEFYSGENLGFSFCPGATPL